MDYKIVITTDAENDLDYFNGYLIQVKKNIQARQYVLNDFDAAKESLKMVADSLKLCDNPRLRQFGYRRINFLYDKYFMLYRIEEDIVIQDNIFHDL